MWARISVVGIEVLTVEARVVVASVDTFLHYAKEMAKLERASSEDEIDFEQVEVASPEASTS
ncbi:hypothetical protein HAL_00890 [Haladaptatus sp. T7]|nr:hypothetical protein HAL_00890 [Haladaptatus sp. T7]